MGRIEGQSQPGEAWSGILKEKVFLGSLDLGLRRNLNVALILMNEQENNNEDMLDEYVFPKGVRGKRVGEYRAGHTVRITKSDSSVEECHFTLEDGAVMIDPDLKAKFPDSDAVNQALRSLVPQ